MKKKHSLLVDLRPALQGFAGIPQEARLLFRGFCLDDEVSVEGFLQMQDTCLAPGIFPVEKPRDETWGTARNFHLLAQVVISVSDEGYSKSRTTFEIIREWVKRRFHRFKLLYGTVNVALGRFDTRHFEDFVWRRLFSKTLSPSDFALVTSKNHRVCAVSWEDMQDDGLDSLSISSTPKYPILDTSGYDIFIAQTPYPGRVPQGTTLVIRYHDAIPIFLPHTISGRRKHEAMHFYALMSNVASGAWFACVSETSRQQLLTLFPEAESRSATIYNIVSPEYFIDDSKSDEVREIVRLRGYTPAVSLEGRSKHHRTISSVTALDTDDVIAPALQIEFRYLLMVSTINSRKNHATFIAAWQAIKRKKDPDLKLILVGSLESDHGPINGDIMSEVANGDLFLLDSVPTNELRVLYRHALATVCPSFSEGFDFSGIEAMRCGGVVVASDIGAHREVYKDAAEYFDPYSRESTINALIKVLYDKKADQVRSNLKRRGECVSARFLPEIIMPEWRSFLEKATNGGRFSR